MMGIAALHPSYETRQFLVDVSKPQGLPCGFFIGYLKCNRDEA